MVDEVTVDLGHSRAIHIVGIGGAGMSGLALVLHAMGHRVSGSDLKASPVTIRLREVGINVVIGHSESALGDADVVTASPAVPMSNVELALAARRGATILTRAQLLGILTRLRRTVAVAGTHGKTTTSTMLSLLLSSAGFQPSFLIGAEVVGIGANAMWAERDLLVLEADESYGSFAELSADVSLITNVEPDHLDHYGTVENLEGAFVKLIERSRSAIVFGDDPGNRRVLARCAASSVGYLSDATYQIRDVVFERAVSSFTLVGPDGVELRPRVGAPGAHNVANAALACAGALHLGVDPGSCVEGLARFAGVPRRFEFRGSARGVTFVDDYAHLPGEVRATVDAARRGGFERIVAVFQPHRYTRIAALADSFRGAFDGADLVVVTDVYGAGETPVPGVTGKLVASAITAGQGAPRVRYLAGRDELVAALASELRAGDLCLTMGAGDLTTVPDQVLEVLA